MTEGATTVAVSPLVTAPPPEPRRPRLLLIGSAFGAVSSALVVLSTLAVYLQLRGDYLAGGGTGAVPEEFALPLTPGGMGMVTLLMSLVSVSWAVWALRRDDRPHAYVAVGLTLLFGVAFINATVYLYQQIQLPVMFSGLGALLYIVTGAHLVMVVIAMVFVAVMGFQSLGGQLTGRDADGMSAAALYWFVTVAVYSVIYYGIYITKF